MPRIVILRHTVASPIEGRDSHWDLMLESKTDCGLETWALEELPIFDVESSNGVVLARQLEPHRTAYLEYEGPVSKDRGFVERVFEGTYERTMLDPNKFEITVLGYTFRGRVLFENLGNAEWKIVFSAANSTSSHPPT